MNPVSRPPLSDRTFGLLVAFSAIMIWAAQPPLRFWPLALVGLVPMLKLAVESNRWRRRQYLVVWAIWFLYWLFSLQGLRFAHPVMYLCWIALAGYLALYPALFLFVTRALLARGIALIVVAPSAWVTIELLRNYLLTGISAAMLGHTLADVPVAIQIADLLGTYGVSFVVVAMNVGCLFVYQTFLSGLPIRSAVPTWLVCGGLMTATLGYGSFRLQHSPGDSLATFALIQRDEPVEYQQSSEREVEMFRNYARQSELAVAEADRVVDVVVWPESMFTGGAPWMTIEEHATVPAEAQMSESEFRSAVVDQQGYFVQRAGYVLDLLAGSTNEGKIPQLLVGCGVVNYAEHPKVYSGVVHLDSDGTVADWYGKTHLVMFGEYVPIAPYIPGLRSLVPPGLGLQQGAGGKVFQMDDTAVAANICIETAVERVTVNQLAELRRGNQMPDVVVTVTNDGWFDHSSVIEHHLRCAQLVAVAVRRPILSAANGGPTAWVDSNGQIVARLESTATGAVIATPRRDDRMSLYLRIGDWPARLCAVVCIGLVASTYRRQRRS